MGTFPRALPARGVGYRARRDEREDIAGVRLPVQDLVEVTPLRVQGVDEAHLPGAGPVLHGLLALDGEADVVMPLIPDEQLQAVLLREACD